MRYFIELQYKGTNYHGWQLQNNAITIQKKINIALTLLLKTDINVVGAGRTDAGVHATQFFAHFDFLSAINTSNIRYKLNALLPDDIVIIDLFQVKDEAHARFNAISRSYEYHIWLGKNPFLKEVSWQIHSKPSVAKMNEAAKWLLSYKDFKCFSKSKTDVNTYNCTITNAVWELTHNKLIFYITADRFLRNMVRAIVGTLLDVGLDKISVDEFKKIIESRNRSNAGVSVPPQGLFLTRVSYPKTIK